MHTLEIMALVDGIQVAYTKIENVGDIQQVRNVLKTFQKEYGKNCEFKYNFILEK